MRFRRTKDDRDGTSGPRPTKSRNHEVRQRVQQDTTECAWGAEGEEGGADHEGDDEPASGGEEEAAERDGEEG